MKKTIMDSPWMHSQDLTTFLGVYKCCENDDDEGCLKQIDGKEHDGFPMNAHSNLVPFVCL